MQKLRGLLLALAVLNIGSTLFLSLIQSRLAFGIEMYRPVTEDPSEHATPEKTETPLPLQASSPTLALARLDHLQY